MLIAITGLLAGFLHVISGPDHLAAVSPLAIENKKSGWLIGLKWGVGHTSGVFIVGILVLLFREIIPVDLVASYSEGLVGIVLIVIGVWGLQKILRKNLHEHEHDGNKHYHIHKIDKNIAKSKKIGDFHTHTALAVGIIHGLAGSSHLLGVLPALALPTKFDAAIYLGFFGIGTILAMLIFSQLLGIIAIKFSQSSLVLYKRLSISFSSIAIAVGVFWIFGSY